MMNLSATLTQILQLDQQTDPVQSTWYIIAAVILSTLNRPKDIQAVYRHVESIIDDTESSDKEKEQQKVLVVMKLREALLKNFIAAGFPKSINALRELELATPAVIKTKLPTSPLRNEETWNEVVEQRKRGRALFGKIYDRHTQRVLDQMSSSHPDLAQAALYQLYGPILSNTAFISARETSLIMVASLTALDLPAQLRGHSFGALHNGASKEDLAMVEKSVKIFMQYHLNLSKL
ncbi:uncharacterized protein BYT42DRAFT_327237 [Radiomyces spectabilis]|uniref:uncharacterized protein n=1 Tax=Radiomyces spectabilis TaxID=64574 RepID=UPI00221EE43F|nr:uncharacterized protein BYT42DRAFT_327237 [Radiomyces spectabilis]KAI8379446.1 hypothetical protein BYT42DRAFT_327237 [Radiomyces spectabilis]